ncbi:MAG: dephospho-CoA kinase [Spirochaetota bacterium]
MIVGVAGKYCAGKNTVSHILENHGYRVIDVDTLGHRALEERKDAIAERFGPGVLKSTEEEPTGGAAAAPESAPGAGSNGALSVDRSGDSARADRSRPTARLTHVDRRALGARVFGNDRARRDLEAIVHPVMVRWVRDFVRDLAGAPGVINAALLFPMGLHKECDRVIWVTAPLPTRILRARARDGLGVVEILRRFRAQRRLLPQQSSRDVEIHTVENRGSSEVLAKQLHALGFLSE